MISVQYETLFSHYIPLNIMEIDLKNALNYLILLKYGENWLSQGIQKPIFPQW